MKLSECPVRGTADVIDGKWKPMIVHAQAFVHGVPPVLYVECIEPELIQQLGISRERAEQPDLYLRIPAHKESIFRSAVDQKGMPVSDALQVWLDVSNPW